MYKYLYHSGKHAKSPENSLPSPPLQKAYIAQYNSTILQNYNSVAYLANLSHSLILIWRLFFTPRNKLKGATVMK